MNKNEALQEVDALSKGITHDALQLLGLLGTEAVQLPIGDTGKYVIAGTLPGILSTAGKPIGAESSTAGAAPQHSELPAILFDGHAVLTEVQARGPNPPRTSADNVAEVLDAVVRLMRAEGARSAQAAPIQASSRDEVLEEAVRACEDERVENTGTEGDRCYNMAITHCTAAIRILKAESPSKSSDSKGGEQA